ncbi:MAG TPA: hypothetical protein VFE05_23470 [Longimicrobiaceae bacterium]|jgi:hypothetical protein|nr:hypothetical protein [Longimicrobiaceae bacterium]
MRKLRLDPNLLSVQSFDPATARLPEMEAGAFSVPAHACGGTGDSTCVGECFCTEYYTCWAGCIQD